MARNKQVENQLEVVSEENNTTYVIDFDGVPCYIGQDFDEVVDYIERAGHSVCYVLTNVVTERTISGKKETTGSPMLCRYINSPIGSTLIPIDDMVVDGLSESKVTISYKLPKLPRVLLDEVDRGFRAVEDVHGTEAIVILTYDMDFHGQANASEGWGFVVPKQTNTSGACHYEHDSVVEDLPDGYEDHIMIAGSIHSHPKMSAFASHTDDHDQLDFSGIHITYGWQSNVNSGRTQYHIEFQLGENKIKLTENEAFEPAPKVDVDTEENKKFLSKVSKSYGISNQRTPGSGGYGGYGGMGSELWMDHDDDEDFGQIAKKALGAGNPSTATSDKDLYTEDGLTRPIGCPAPTDVGLIVNLLTSATRLCPCCNSSINQVARETKKCANPKCGIYFLWPGQTVVELIQDRNKKNLSVLEIDRNTKPDKPVVKWVREVKPGGNVENGPFEHEVKVLYEPEVTTKKV